LVFPREAFAKEPTPRKRAESIIEFEEMARQEIPTSPFG
jgi:hypothetical protein